MAKRYYNLEKETKQYLNFCNSNNITVSDSVKTINDFIIYKKTQNKTCDHLTKNPVVLSGLALWLDGSVSSSYTGGNIWYDLAGNNHGTFINGYSFSTQARGCLSFNGVVGTGNYVQGNISGFTNNDPFTLIAWYKSNVTGKEQHFVNLKATNQNATQFYVSVNNKLAAQSWSNVIGNTTLTSNVWYMVALTRDISNNGIYYLNGVVDGSGLFPNYNPASQYIVASYVNNQNYNLNGFISLAQIYNRPLSQAEIIQNYNATKWRFL